MSVRNALALILTCCILTFAGRSICAEDDAKSPEALKKEIRASMKKAIDWLLDQQNADGSFGKEEMNPAFTGMAVTAIARSPLRKDYVETPAFQKAVKYILSCAKEDGGIYNSDWAANYNTSICLGALASLENKDYAKQIKQTQNYLKGLQAGARSELESADKDFYGGWGYRKGFSGADLSNTVITLTALKDSGLSADDETWKRALQFVEKCQNTKVDGGFIYRPNESKAGVDENGNYRSYQSMTYSGLLSMIFANVDRNDERVKAAHNWIKKHWDLSENTPIGKQGLFYNYQTLAKALNAYGEKYVVSDDKEKHDWYRELAERLLAEQNEKGFWVNTEERWFETNPILVTCYCLLALDEGFADYK